MKRSFWLNPTTCSVADHRGREVPLLNDAEINRDSSIPKHIRAAILRRIDKRAEPSLHNQSRFLALVTFIPSTVIVTALVIVLQIPEKLNILIISCSTGFFCPYVFLAIRNRLFAAPLTAACLAEGCCPSCGYRIAEVPSDPADGCVVCPECGAAWKLPRLPPSTSPITAHSD